MKRLILFCLLMGSIACYGQATPKPLCKGTTKAGMACKSTTLDSTGYCRHHSALTVRCAAIRKSTGAKCMMIPAKGKTLCWVHEEMK